ncbi:MAG: histone deacetylase [Bacteriovoracaceae bacterium]|nr:histone deacetylase [Bacteriovoracaceae bacterium]
MKVFTSELYPLGLPVNHRFPAIKYKILKQYLLEENIIQLENLKESPLASFEELNLAHTDEYIFQMKSGNIPPEIMKRIGFPWSVDLYLRSCATVGGTLAASQCALVEGISGNLAGGTHHSHKDRGEGYCVFNDIAVSTRFLQANKLVQNVAIIDLDVHQGNGNSSILFYDPNVFIFSVHGEKNYPFKKVPSHLDIGLPDGCEDEEYIEALLMGMDEIIKFNPDFVFYIMGADPLIYDRLGTLNISFDGLMRRDRIVIRFCFENKIPLVLTLGGGYSEPIIHSVHAYANTYRVVNEIYCKT